MVTLGLDPGLNSVGYCFLQEDGTAVVNTVKAPSSAPQFIKMVGQRDALRKALDHNQFQIQYIGIEQPYVPGAGFRAGGGGEQSANMWAVYSMLLDTICEARLPVVMFNITQFHSLILKKRGLSKTEIVAKAKEEQSKFGRIDQHAADAYFVAKNARSFWRFMDAEMSASDLTPDQRDIFLSRREGNKGKISGTVWRAGDFWYDFRKNDPLTSPIGLAKYVTEGRVNLTPQGDEGIPRVR
jgi:Holliday junction resolvasome RuvABC endonuclease subunit